jgi:hypothetical protein
MAIKYGGFDKTLVILMDDWPFSPDVWFVA